MLTRDHRFHGYNSLNRAYRYGDTIRDSQVSLKYYLNPRRSSYRVAVVVSRKVSKSAVTRNRIRRRIYEIIRGFNLEPTKGYDLIFSVYHDDLAAIPSLELKQIIQKHLTQAGLINTNNKT